jgi:hypothetical protein
MWCGDNSMLRNATVQKKCPATWWLPDKPLSEEKLPKIALRQHSISICRANCGKNNFPYLFNVLAMPNALMIYISDEPTCTNAAQQHKTRALIWGCSYSLCHAFKYLPRIGR